MKTIDRVLTYLNSKKEYSNTGKELSYWTKTGIDKGFKFYEEYLKRFRLSDKYFKDKRIGDFGCGPFGGIISMIKEYRAAYPIDILADEYNRMNLSKERIIRFDGEKTLLQSGSMDLIFCCNTIDHTRYPKDIIKEIYRLLADYGELYLSVHLRNSLQTNRTHPVAWNKKLFTKLFKDFDILWMETDDTDKINECNHATLYAKLIKK